jgi:hypothetical protein
MWVMMMILMMAVVITLEITFKNRIELLFVEVLLYNLKVHTWVWTSGLGMALI